LRLSGTRQNLVRWSEINNTYVRYKDKDLNKLAQANWLEEYTRGEDKDAKVRGGRVTESLRKCNLDSF
jgi:hypothetical protein